MFGGTSQSIQDFGSHTDAPEAVQCDAVPRCCADHELGTVDTPRQERLAWVRGGDIPIYPVPRKLDPRRQRPPCELLGGPGQVQRVVRPRRRPGQVLCGQRSSDRNTTALGGAGRRSRWPIGCRAGRWVRAAVTITMALTHLRGDRPQLREAAHVQAVHQGRAGRQAVPARARPPAPRMQHAHSERSAHEGARERAREGPRQSFHRSVYRRGRRAEEWERTSGGRGRKERECTRRQRRSPIARWRGGRDLAPAARLRACRLIAPHCSRRPDIV
eukprot:COSAG01_NODE_3012_length_6723_cov_13.578351_2_plen_273_part_00